MRMDSSGTLWKIAYFKDCPIGGELWANGNRWLKHTNRTAEIVWPKEYGNKRFYFGQYETCEIQYGKETQNG